MLLAIGREVSYDGLFSTYPIGETFFSHAESKGGWSSASNDRLSRKH